MTLDPANNLATLFVQQATRQPDASALITPDNSISFRDLDLRSARIAAALQGLGIAATADETALVGLCMPRGVDAVAAMLGILRAGGAYVPIDPGYPASRRRRMAQSADIRVLLTDDDSISDAFATSVEQVLTLSDLDQQSQTRAPAPVADDSLFHVLFTSGSTGEPKGVCGTHRQMRQRLAWLWRTFPFGDGDLCCHKTALHFVDASLEIFGTLLQGRPLLIAPEDHTANPERFTELLAQHRVTRISLVVSQLRALLIADPDLGRKLPRLALCIVSGERLTGDLIQAFRRALPNDHVEGLITPADEKRARVGWISEAHPPGGDGGCASLIHPTAPSGLLFHSKTRLINLYGCSEVPEISWAEITPDTPIDDTGAPIGHAIPGTRLYIVDEAMREVAPGEVGELLVASPLQAKGYLGRPEETAARFIIPPFGGAERLYRTGDRVRLPPDGLLRYEGRVDDQVKIRGHRIELSAVEATVTACGEDVDAVAVVVQQDPTLVENRSLVAFVTPASVDTDRLLARLRQQVPRHLLAQRILPLDRLPTTASGKIDRQRLAALANTTPEAPSAPSGNIRSRVTQLWKAVLQVDSVGQHENFFDIGGDSLRLARLHRRLQETFDTFELTVSELLAYPTVAAQAGHLARTPTPSIQICPRRPDPGGGRDIAVIGMACRFPGASTLEAFWRNLRAGVDSISDFSDQELEQPDLALANSPDYVKSGAVLENIADFDAGFFGYSEKEAALLDPQHRLLLECAWEAMESAGVAPDGPVGVYAGSSTSSYFLNHLAAARPVTEATLQDFQANLACDRNFLATRIAYKLALRGPAMTVQTACSTGLVAVHMACQALRAGECAAALAGAGALRIPQKVGYLYEEGMIRSPDGRCRAFDARGEGTLFGSGAGMVLLKPLARAQADGDPILAIIKGSAVNNDAADKVGYTAPSMTGQADVIEAALDAARVDPRTIGYVEAHGTGTRLGDPIEVAALTRAFARRGWTIDGHADGSEPRCAMGSVKTNIGHLDEAAGIAGFIKTVLALRHGEIPPSLHYHAPNPEIDFEHSPFAVNARLTPWPAARRRAGVSSFGMGGTNCHLILDEAPPSPKASAPPEAETEPSHQLLVFSAASHAALETLAGRYRDLIAAQPSIDLASLCATAAMGRRHLGYRSATVAASTADLRDRLANLPLPSVAAGANGAATGKIAFLFTGQGAQYANMARGLYDGCAPFRATLDHCASILDPLLPRPLLSVMFPEPSLEAEADALLAQTQYTQPALFAVEFALAELWRAFGVLPDLVMGHSIGEYVAACVAGAIELDDALRIVAARGRLLQALPAGGGMLSVELDEQGTRKLLAPHEGACIAALNGPARTVISGRMGALAMLAERLAEQGIAHRYLKVSHAFHSPLVEPMLAPFAKALGGARLAEPKIPLISNLTGVASMALLDPDYWVNHTRSAVRFADGVRTLLDLAAGALLEIGPSPTLLGMASEILEDRPAEPPALFPSLRRGRDDWAVLLGSLGRLYARGLDVDWRGLYAGQPWRKVALPTTPFQRTRCWIDPAQPQVDASANASADVSADVLGARLTQAMQRLQARGQLTETEAERLGPLLLAELREQQDAERPWDAWRELIYAPVWRSSPARTAQDRDQDQARRDATGAVRWIILADRGGVGAALAARVEAAGHHALLFYPDETSAPRDPTQGALNPQDAQRLATLLQEDTAASSGIATCVVYLWALDAAVPAEADSAALLAAQQTVCGRVLGLVKPWLNGGARLWLVTRGAQLVDAEKPQVGFDASDPTAFDSGQATLWGLGRTFALEHPQGWGGLIDLSPRQGIEISAEALWTELRHSMSAPGTEPDGGEQVALRDGVRHVARLDPDAGQSALASTSVPIPIRADASYLITGGLGALGLEVAETLVDQGARHLILVTRRGIVTSEQDERVARLREGGVTVWTPMLDVADERALGELLVSLGANLGVGLGAGRVGDSNEAMPPLKGIIHAAGTIAPVPSTPPVWSRFASILAAKVAGAWNLHRLSRDQDLDLFVLFSSASSLLGLSGHGDYAAANAFLDALARWRSHQGLPALSIGWGDWAGVGMAADAVAANAVAPTGLGALPLDRARDALVRLLGQRGHFAVLDADWPRFLACFQAHGAFLAECLHAGDGDASNNTPPGGVGLRALLAAADEPARERLLRERLTTLVAEVLGRADGQALDTDANLLSLGFDSLLLIDLRNRLRRDLGVQIPLSQMLLGMPIDAMVAEAAKEFGGEVGDTAVPTDCADTQPAPTTTDARDLPGEEKWTTVVL
uniref:Acyl transferase domain-containing protein n=1 Tax=Candidatus Kentrum sp. UNK TaxID=2126344 RepID=A0A451AGE1_9GAMM|nr:MAG: Acyl transferase domain-containing protein [Candidatus Kentron sp. UNK]VFK71366.1 MAG: Acyl transferase domain-containing protein [Candidatus Kentron sp. UNK]